jgi:hypothetical protein
LERKVRDSCGKSESRGDAEETPQTARGKRVPEVEINVVMKVMLAIAKIRLAKRPSFRMHLAFAEPEKRELYHCIIPVFFLLLRKNQMCAGLFKRRDEIFRQMIVSNDVIDFIQ